jgi:predicted negative regulator of RcsB-dependent stress response
MDFLVYKCPDDKGCVPISKIARDWPVCYFLRLHTISSKEGTVGTTKLTRKEILAEDPVHGAIIQLIDLFRESGKKIGIIAVIVVLVGIGIYGGIQYLESRESQAQEILGQGIEFFHGQVAADATNDPYSKGASPTFRSESDKYQAATKQFLSVIDRHGFGKIPVIARYYLALCQIQTGNKKEAIQNLQAVAGNSKDRTVGYLSKKVLATEYAGSGNNKAAEEILDGMLKDPQCQLPREDLSLQLARVLDAQGKRAEAIKLLREATAQGASFSVFQQQLMLELDKLQKVSVAGSETQGIRP